jgi:hypothetical protein
MSLFIRDAVRTMTAINVIEVYTQIRVSIVELIR